MEVSDDQIYRGDKTHNHLRYYNIYKPVYLAPEEQYPQKMGFDGDGNMNNWHELFLFCKHNLAFYDITESFETQRKLGCQ